MKKFLSLVLALVMTMSLVTVSAGAKDFTDSKKINYAEAVDVMSAVKVLDGYTDGSFNPQATLTRGAAAKIICNLILGPTTAAALSADTAPYKDVPTNHTFAGYIAYCQQQGIISGYADGTFRPAASLTGYAFMKMLLGALGYDVDVEGYTGANWSIAVAKRALNIGLNDGLEGNFVGTKPVTREEAALYALNTLTADMVEYDTTIQIGDVTVAGSKAKAVENKGKTDGNIYDVDGIKQFAEQYFSNLKVDGGEDSFLRPSNVWTLKSDAIGTYPIDADVTYTKGFNAGDIYKDLGLNKTILKSDVTVAIDGNVEDANAKSIRKGSSEGFGAGNGTLSEVYFDEVNGTVKIVEVNTYIGSVNKTVKATDKKEAFIEITTSVNGSTAPAGASGTEDFETNEKFEDDAYILYTFSKDADSVQSVVLAESVDGVITKVVNNPTDTHSKKVTLGDKVYETAATIANSLLTSISVDQGYTAYLDEYGYIITVNEEEFKDYALVLEIEGAHQAGFNTNRAKLLFTDGSSKVVDLAKDYKKGGVAQYEIVSFKTTDEGEYKLKEVATENTHTVGAHMSSTFKIENGVAKITTGGTQNVVYANSASMFVVKDHGDYDGYTGIKNVPTIKANGGVLAKDKVEAFWYCKSGASLTVMFVLPGSDGLISNVNNKLMFLAMDSEGDNFVHDTDGDYYVYNAVVNGEIKEVKVDKNASVLKADGTASSTRVSDLNGLYSTFSVDKDGFVTSLTEYDTTSSNDVYAGYGVGSDRNTKEYTVTIKNGTDTVITTSQNAGIYTVADGAKFYEIDADHKITTGAYSSVKPDTDDRLYFIVDGGVITHLFVEDIDTSKNAGDDASTLGNLKVLGMTYDANKFTVNVAADVALTNGDTLAIDVYQDGYKVGTFSAAGGPVAKGGTFTVNVPASIVAAPGEYKVVVTSTHGSDVVASGSAVVTLK